MEKCKKCSGKIMLLTGSIYLRPDSEPYESEVEEETEVDEVEKYCSISYCENCDELIEKTFSVSGSV